jgi:hypothetical protein
MKTLPPPKGLPPIEARLHSSSQCAALASMILHATRYLITCGYSLDHMRNLTGGGTKSGVGVIDTEKLHKNSVMKIGDLRIGYATLQLSDPANEKSRKHWVEAPEGSLGVNDAKGNPTPGRYQWMWNPQIDTFEKLERILSEAVRMGFDTRSTIPPVAPEIRALAKKAARGTKKAAAKAKPKVKAAPKKKAIPKPAPKKAAPKKKAAAKPKSKPVARERRPRQRQAA